MHKKTDFFSNSVYEPIQVGKELSGEDFGFIGDNNGVNISSLNPYFCETTAQYWAWKNLRCQYIGLCHYRRYFAEEFTCENIESKLKGVNFILVKKSVFPISIFDVLVKNTSKEDAVLFIRLLEKYVGNRSLVDAFFAGRNAYNPRNMFVCRKSLFDEFCSWQFPFLFKLYEVLPKSPYSRQRRSIGYFAEPMLSLYCYINDLCVKEMPIVSMLRRGKTLHRSHIKDLLSNIRFHTIPSKKVLTVSDDVLVGLKNDKYLQKIENVQFK